MTINTLSLPIDIPWRRLAVSSDMCAVSPDDPLPLKWRSSLAVFSYDPPPEEDPELTNPDERTTFLKIVATVTGYQPEGAELDQSVLRSRSFGTSVIKAFERLTDNYYPAHGAIVQVAVFPVGGNWSIAQYPYLTDFEPKKREVIELVSATGETVTQSGTELNVRKGTTSTNSTEIMDVNKGGSFGFTSSSETGGQKSSISAQGSTQKEVGKRTTDGSSTINVINTDASREKRESLSHTTNLSQLYQLLDSYHSGTNRAVFFLNARPHILDSDYTFVKGPRRLEGIQEFFLVVRRPKDMENICVTAVLETAHLHETQKPITVGETRYEQNQLTQTFTDSASTGTFDSSFKPSDQHWKINIPAGYKLDVSRGGGSISYGDQTFNLPAGVSIVKDDVRGTDYNIPPGITPYDDHVDIDSHIEAGNFGRSASRQLTVTVYYRSVEPVETPRQETERHVDLFFTARKVSSCSARIRMREGAFVTYEKAMSSSFQRALVASHQQGRDAAAAANEVSRLVHDEVISSFRPSRRYELGQVEFLHSRFAARQLLDGIRIDNSELASRPLHEIEEVPERLRARLREQGSTLTLSDALQRAPEHLAGAMGVGVHEATQLLVGLVGVRAATGYHVPSQQEATSVSATSSPAPDQPGDAEVTGRKR